MINALDAGIVANIIAQNKMTMAITEQNSLKKEKANKYKEQLQKSS